MCVQGVLTTKKKTILESKNMTEGRTVQVGLYLKESYCANVSMVSYKLPMHIRTYTVCGKYEELCINITLHNKKTNNIIRYSRVICPL